MKCYTVRKYLEKLAAGEIEGVLAGQLHGHLQSCPGCREEYREMKLALEMWRQTAKSGPAPQFSSAWRQRVRQEAFRKEADSRSFFSVWKSNTLVPALGVLAIFLVYGLFSIYKYFTPQVVIEPLIKKYTPALSSSVGIPLTAKFLSGKTPRNITYHWIAEYGLFLSWEKGKVTELGADTVTRGNKVYWSVDFNDKKESPSFEIRLQVKDSKKDKTVAQTKLRIAKDENGFFTVKEVTKHIPNFPR